MNRLLKKQIDISLLVDGQQYNSTEVEKSVLQGSPVSPIMFAIFMDRIFKEVIEEIEEYVHTSFADY